MGLLDWLGGQPKAAAITSVFCSECKHGEFIGVSTGYSVTLEGGIPVLQATRMQLECSHCHASFVCRVDGQAPFALEKCESGGLAGPRSVGRLSGEAEDQIEEVIKGLPRTAEELMDRLEEDGSMEAPDAASMVAALGRDPRINQGD